MKSELLFCDPDRAEAFLSGKMDATEEQLYTEHMENCEACRSQLEHQAADAESWNEAGDFLKPNEFDDLPTRPATSVQASQVLDALNPSDDPAMLGRLGSYEISGVVGIGGMGVVLKGFDRALDRAVAIKVMSPHLASCGAARNRFAREAKAAAAVIHPNVIAIHGVVNKDSLPWLVMPYIKGHSLQKRLDERGTLPVREVLRIGVQVAAGLSAAHSQGLVHRDIKPANVLLEKGVERVTITDFGLARAVDDATMTRSGVIAGTPQYMSPEQSRGETLDSRSDMFSLGSLMYAMCTGRSPFRAETTYGVIRRITEEEPRPIREINPQIPDWLCEIIERLMAKSPDDRFQNCEEVSYLLEDCLAHVQQPSESALPAFTRIKPQKLTGKLSNKTNFFQRFAWIAWLSAAFLGFGLLAFAWWAGGDPPEIAGQWTGRSDDPVYDWGSIELTKTEDGKYTGTYDATYSGEPGTIKLKWSRIERRFNGKWKDGEARFGNLSIRLVDDEIRAAWSASKKCKRDPGNPKLGDLIWKKSASKNSASKKSASIADKKAPDPNKPITGRVVEVREELFTISLGYEDLVVKGHVFAVSRNGQKLGKAQVVRVKSNQAICKLTEVDATLLPVQIGDQIKGPVGLLDPNLKNLSESKIYSRMLFSGVFANLKIPNKKTVEHVKVDGRDELLSSSSPGDWVVVSTELDGVKTELGDAQLYNVSANMVVDENNAANVTHYTVDLIVDEKQARLLKEIRLNYGTVSVAFKNDEPDSTHDRYARYVDGMMRSYDKNKDGRLSKEEVGEMRRPPEGADINKDGFITKAEYLLHCKNKNSSKRSSSGAARLHKENERQKQERIKEELRDLSLKMTSLEQEQNFFAARAVELRILELLKSNDELHEQIKSLRLNMIEARLQKQNAEAERFSAEIDERETLLINRYKKLDLIHQLQVVENKILEPMRRSLNELTTKLEDDTTGDFLNAWGDLRVTIQRKSREIEAAYRKGDLSDYLKQSD